ncbi:Serine-threonine/tyrosine-protein kinase, catalytic domain [Sesbania bispinosa]|nr:Serine-threonine/tyrosine-protein kinase, catalytic domain [Sesbania bispinosa]
MAFDQNSSANDMRPQLTVARTVPEEPLVLPASTTAVNGASGAMPLFYPASVSDAGLVGMGYGNVASGAAPTTWCVRPAVPIRHPTVNPAAAFSHAPSFPNRVVGGNAVDLSGSFVATAHGYPLNLGNWVTGNALDNGLQGNSRVVSNASDHAGGGALGGNGVNPPASQRADQASEEGGGDDSVSGRKLKIMCSYGGKILPRPSDGMLRYVGGQTRIISVKRDVRFNDLVQKMVNIFGQPVVIKYQLPDEDLDALVSVSCPEDLENMMEEYERLIERSPDGSPKLRVFLFSASELDPSGMVQFVNLQDGGQRYVEAVNGITDGVGGKLTRKGSITSAASTQNSDLSGVEALDNSNAAQGDVSGAPVSSALSPEGNVAASHDATANFVVSEPVASIHSDASAVSLGIPVTNSGPTQAPPFQNEVELEKSVPITLSQQQFGLQQSGMEIPPPAPLQAFVDPRQEVMNHADYVQLPPHMGFPNPQLLGKPGSIYSQHQFHDNSPRLASHQVIPAVQMTMTQPSSHAGVRPSVIQPQTFMQLQQNHLNQYNDENTSGLRIHQLPPEQSYNAYPVQFPYGGNYGWVQVSPPEHVIFPDALLPQQPAMIPEKVQRVEDCYMCQKKLPHAHSDPVVQDQQNSCAGPIADSIPSYHSLPMEDNLRPQPINKVLVTAPMKEGNVEQAVGTRPRVISKLEPPGVVHCTDATGLPLEPEGERIFIMDRSDHPRNAAVIQETIGRTDDIMRQQVAPVENRAKEDVVVNKPVNNDIPLVGGTSISTSECMVQESPTEYTNKLASTISKADAVENWIKQDLLKPIDGRMDTLKMGNPEFFVNNDRFDYSTQHAVEKKGVVFDNNLGRPVEYNEVTQLPVWGIPGSNPQSKNGNHQKDDAVLSSISPSVRFGDVQDSSNSLFSNQDPWNVHATYFPPPRPNKIALKKEYSYKDQLCENLGNSGEQNLEPQLDDGLYQTFKQNLTLEEAQSAKEERQLQAVAEGLAASVLNSSTSSNPRDVSHCENIDNGDVQNNLIDIQCKDKTLDVKSKVPEKANFGFPASDVGSLQVIKNCDLEELIELGSGTFGTVYHGKWRGTDVAIKRINDRCFAGKPSEQERLRADFWNEAVKLADLHHPNVVAFYGVVLDGPGGSVATVTEYMVNGSLRNSLQKNGRNLDKRKRLLIAMDVAFGMEYLHGKNIVHFDLKSDNLLVNLRDPHRPICKVGDLGLSKVKCQTLISGGVRGTLPWMAPELLNGSSSLVSEKVDVFSFGIVMWELLTGEEPYADLHYGAIIGGIVNNTLRPPVPESCDPEWRLLMERCWSSEPSERPSFTEIANELRSMAAKISPKGQNQQQQPASSQSQVQK